MRAARAGAQRERYADMRIRGKRIISMARNVAWRGVFTLTLLTSVGLHWETACQGEAAGGREGASRGEAGPAHGPGNPGEARGADVVRVTPWGIKVTQERRFNAHLAEHVPTTLRIPPLSLHPSLAALGLSLGVWNSFGYLQCSTLLHTLCCSLCCEHAVTRFRMSRGLTDVALTPAKHGAPLLRHNSGSSHGGTPGRLRECIYDFSIQMQLRHSE